MNSIEIPTSRATVAESCDLVIKAGLLIKNSSVEDDYLNQQAELLNSKGEEMKVSLATDRSKEKTEELAVLDNKRDDLISAIKYMLRGHMKWNKNGQAELAKKIFSLLKKHGLRITHENYEEESALVESLLNDLDKPDNQEALTTLNIAELVTDLKQAQADFSKTYVESAKIEGGKTPVVAATKLKKDVRLELIKVVDYLNAMNTARYAEYGTLAAGMAELVNGLNQKVQNRYSQN